MVITQIRALTKSTSSTGWLKSYFTIIFLSFYATVTVLPLHGTIFQHRIPQNYAIYKKKIQYLIQANTARDSSNPSF